MSEVARILKLTPKGQLHYDRKSLTELQAKVKSGFISNSCLQACPRQLDILIFNFLLSYSGNKWLFYF